MQLNLNRSQLSDLFSHLPYPIRQRMLGIAYALVPRRLSGLAPLAWVSLRESFAGTKARLPVIEMALDNPDGLICFAGKIGVSEIIAGYRRGAYLMHHVGPMKWWAPRNRMVLFFDRARIEKNTRRLMRQGKFQVSFDEAFDRVVEACAEPRPGSVPISWITPKAKAMLRALHEAGFAHSAEVWRNGELVGGAFGIAVGRIFQTESQFHTVPNASKIGFAVLNQHLQAWGFAVNDGRHPTRYLADSGLIPITREEFSALSREHARPEFDRPGPWEVDDALSQGDWKPAEADGISMEILLPGGTNCRYTAEELMTTKRGPTW